MTFIYSSCQIKGMLTKLVSGRKANCLLVFWLPQYTYSTVANPYERPQWNSVSFVEQASCKQINLISLNEKALMIL